MEIDVYYSTTCRWIYEGRLAVMGMALRGPREGWTISRVDDASTTRRWSSRPAERGLLCEKTGRWKMYTER